MYILGSFQAGANVAFCDPGAYTGTNFACTAILFLYGQSIVTFGVIDVGPTNI